MLDQEDQLHFEQTREFWAPITMDDLGGLEWEEQWWRRRQTLEFAKLIIEWAAEMVESDNNVQRIIGTTLCSAALAHLDPNWVDYRERMQRLALTNDG